MLLARRMGKTRIIAETGAGQHGVATATAAALFGLPCDVYMGAVDVERQALNVFRMELLGARVIPVQSGSRTLKDAMNEALRDWVTNVGDTHYIIGSVAGPHPYPALVRDFQSVIGREARAQCLDFAGRLPDAVVACVGGGSNAMGIFSGFVDDPSVRAGRRRGGRPRPRDRPPRRDAGARHARACSTARRATCCRTPNGQILEAHSISAGLDYPGVGPEHSYLRTAGGSSYARPPTARRSRRSPDLARLEGIIPALETAHAVHAARLRGAGARARTGC